MKVRCGFDEEVYGEISVGPDGTLVYAPTKPDYLETLQQLAESYARQIELDDDTTLEMLQKMTAVDILKRMVERMQAKRMWCDEVKD